MQNNQLLGVVILMLFMSCGPDQKEAKIVEAEIKVNAKVIYPKSREWMSPDGGTVTQFNPPSLLWPVSKNADYTVRLSRDKDFVTEVITKEGLPFAMFNPHKKLEEGTWFWQVKSADGNWSETAQFTIAESTTEFVTPNALTLLSQIPSERPRLYAWKSKLEDLRKRAKGYEESEEILAEADKLLNIPVINEKEALPKFKGRNERENRRIAIDASRPVCDRVQYVVSTLAHAYILTVNEKYAKSGCIAA